MTIESGGMDLSTSKPGSVASGTANSKGSWVELIASTANANEWAKLFITVNDSTAETYKIDIGVGAASSEVVVIPDIVFYSKTDGQEAHALLIPITIASGSRVSIRGATASGSVRNFRASIQLNDVSDIGTCSNIDALGVGSSRGVTIDPGGTANTQGSWIELIASTSAEYTLIIPMINVNNNGGLATTDWVVDIGIGGSGSEVVLIGEILKTTTAFETHSNAYNNYHITVASGSRLSARAQCGITDAADRLLDVSILGCQFTAPTGGGGDGIPKLIGNGGLIG